MSDQDSVHSNLTSVWGIIRGHIDTMVDRAISLSHMQVAENRTTVGGFKLRLKNILEDSLTHIHPGYQSGLNFHAIHEEIKGALEKAVDTAMGEVTEHSSDSSAKESFVDAVDKEIEHDVYYAGYGNTSQNESGFFESLSMKDETVFVALVSMGVIIPIIFFTLIFIFFYKKHREAKKKSHEMLLRDRSDLCVDEYNGDDKYRLDDEVPDLDLKHLRM
ncbi:unnamed protein product [Candidula unifasciata]|uniref:Uncharacterized protein n=1 Tax=Candidula unifasciata TaxID=100452 RepID=A0A8S3ZEP5_9EUPU|nr:unnamed protein product [Candidula unifasciata]